MDKKSIIIIVLIGVLVIAYWPIVEFLGFTPPPKQTTDSLQVTDNIQTATSQPVSSEPIAQSVTDTPVDYEVQLDVAQSDIIPVDTIIVATSKYRVMLSSLGGGPVSILLNDYSHRDGLPIEMMPYAERATPEGLFAGGTFSTSQLYFTCNLMPGSYDATHQSLELVYTHQSPSGGVIERKFVFYPDRHHFDLSFRIDDPSKFGFERVYEMCWNTPLGTTEPSLELDYQAMEAVAMMADSRENLDDFKDGQLDQELTGSATWAGVRSMYFAAVIIPQNRKADAVSARGVKREIYTPNGSVEERQITVALDMPFASINTIADSFTVFVGPLDYMMMEEYDVGLEDMLDIGTTPVIGWLIKPFAIAIIWILPKLYNVVPNYGLVIILFALLVKIVTLPLSLKSFKSMQAMKDLQPKVDELKKKHKKDPQKMNKEMMQMYKRHGVNPMSGCLPILPQMPLFFALFSVFRSTILLRDAPFVWFIDDLSRGAQSLMDPYMLLVVLMVVAQFVSQKLTMAQSQQNKMLIYAMPLVMGFIFYKFAAGLVLYWTSFSILSLLDYLVFKRKKRTIVATT